MQYIQQQQQQHISPQPQHIQKQIQSPTVQYQQSPTLKQTQSQNTPLKTQQNFIQKSETPLKSNHF
jgi:hypothetical protein